MATKKPTGGAKVGKGHSKPTTMPPKDKAPVPKRETVKVFFQIWPAVTGDIAKRAIAGLKWTVTAGLGKDAFVQEGATDATGAVEFKMDKTEVVTLQILGTSYQLTYKDITADKDIVEGVRQRLAHLGYRPIGNETVRNDVNIDFGMDHHILCFQADHGLEIHGEVESQLLPGLNEGIHLSAATSGYPGAKFSAPFANKLQPEAGV
jgi:hypothetical protein